MAAACLVALWSPSRGHNAMTRSCATMKVKAPNEPCRASSQSRDVPRAREDSVVMASQVFDGPRRHFGHVVDGDGTCLFLRTLRRDLFWRVVPLHEHCYSRSTELAHILRVGCGVVCNDTTHHLVELSPQVWAGGPQNILAAILYYSIMTYIV
jgi:hypothetical protein